MIDITKLKRLGDYFNYKYADNADAIIVNGKEYSYEIALSFDYPDDMCCRALINGAFYYFGD